MELTGPRQGVQAPRRAHARRARDPPREGAPRGGGKAAVTYFLRLRSGQPGRLDRRLGPLPARSPAGGPDAGNPGRELGLRRRDLVLPGRRLAKTTPPTLPPLALPAPHTPAGPGAAHELVRPRVPHELLPLLTPLPAALLLFLDDHLDGGVQVPRGAGGYEEAGVRRAEAPSRTGTRGEQRQRAQGRPPPLRYAAAANSGAQGHTPWGAGGAA